VARRVAGRLDLVEDTGPASVLLGNSVVWMSPVIGPEMARHGTKVDRARDAGWRIVGAIVPRVISGRSAGPAVLGDRHGVDRGVDRSVSLGPDASVNTGIPRFALLLLTPPISYPDSLILRSCHPGSPPSLFSQHNRAIRLIRFKMSRNQGR
jgi:hypothetical protein